MTKGFINTQIWLSYTVNSEYSPDNFCTRLYYIWNKMGCWMINKRLMSQFDCKSIFCKPLRKI